MRWESRQESSNVEDRRGSGMKRKVAGGASGVLLVVVMVAGYYGIDLSPLLNLTGGGTTEVSQPYTPTAEEQELARFTSVVLKSTEDVWGETFRRSGQNYPNPTLVLYSGSTNTACGYGESAMGPFYCPADGNVYIDLSFYRDMQTKMGGGGDFALGYVLAHEVGHHVQNVLGISTRMRQMQAGASKAEANRLSVMLELQADCLAGVWGHHMQREGILETGDLEEALRTAAAIGDDRLQRQATGRVVPDSFTHGTSEQRFTWFKRGFDSGSFNQCDTFSGAVR